MQIFIKTPNGMTITLDVQPNTTVKDVKMLIQGYQGIFWADLRLVFVGRQLADGSILSDYNIKMESTIHALLSLRGGMYHVSSGRTGLVGQTVACILKVRLGLVRAPGTGCLLSYCGVL
jgi:hypothetical protein